MERVVLLIRATVTWGIMQVIAPKNMTSAMVCIHLM